MHRRVAVIGVLVALAAGASAQVPLGIETFDAAWRIVRDTHFDQKFNGVDWDAARVEFRPKAEAAKTSGELRGVITTMLSRLGQSHFAILPASADPSPADGASASGGEADPGFDVRLIGDDLVVTRVDAGRGGAQAGVRPGWRLLAVAGKPVADVLRNLPQTTDDRLRGLQAWRIAQSRLRGSDGSFVELRFDDGSTKDGVKVAVQRQREQGLPVKVGSLPQMFVRVTEGPMKTPSGRNAGVIGFNVWMASVDASFARAVDKYRSADGIVIDLRGNPGGLAALIVGVSGHFVPDRKVLGVMKTRDNTLEFKANPRLVDTSGNRVAVYDGPVAIIVDAMSGSASECFAGGMQSIGRVRVFGQTTMGQALPALFDRLPNGDVMIHAYADFVTGDGTRLEGRGVVPDEPTPLAREDLLAGRDRALEAALAWIDAGGRKH
jgi:carboxyl-terminal processing protease